MSYTNIGNALRNLARRDKLILLICTDCLIAFLCWVVFGPPFAFMIASNFESSLHKIIQDNILSFIVPFFLTFFYFIWSGFYRSLMKFFDSKDSIFRALLGSLTFGISWGITYLSQYDSIRTDYLSTVILQAFLLSAVFYAFLQISRDIAQLIIYPVSERFNGKPVLIYGAGSAGNELYQAIKVNPAIKVIGFYDNSPTLSGAEINNLKIYGKHKHIKKLSEKYPNMEIYLAIPSLSTNQRRRIISSLEGYKVAIRSMPALHDVVEDEKALLQIQELSLDDILPRKIVRKSDIRFDNKTILITGAGGSIGSELTRQICRLNPSKIILLDNSEFNLYQINRSLINEFADAIECNLQLVDVCDEKTMEIAFERLKPDVVFHAAAFKHVPMGESNPIEMLKNNVIGTKNVVKLALKYNIKSLTFISTDKAVDPCNIMGASKRIGEMIIRAAANQTKISISAVRFGNVLDSAGSVLPLFEEQIAMGGPVTITHNEVERYFMTAEEASRLVLQATALNVNQTRKDASIYILEMGNPVRISNLAKQLIRLRGLVPDRDIKIKYTGLRPGEKITETLMNHDESLESTYINGIKRLTEEMYTPDDMRDRVRKLIRALNAHDEVRVKAALFDLLPEFIPNGSLS